MESSDIAPILAGLILIGMPLIVIMITTWVIKHEKHKTKMTQAIVDMYTKAIEKGEKLPENFPVLSIIIKRNPLNTAIILISAGLGVSLFMFLAVNHEWRLRAMAIGIIPIIMGIGYLVVYLISPRK